MATRTRINCFNNLHQIRKKLKLNSGLNPEAYLERLTHGHLRDVWGMSRAEIDATMNMLRFIPEGDVEKLSNMAAKYGMTGKGPFSHASLACPATRQGFTPIMEATEFAENMTSKTTTVSLIIRRECQDFEDAPLGMRKPITVDRVYQYQKICRLFEWCLETLASDIPGPSYAAEKTGLFSMFELGLMDESLAHMADEQAEPFNNKTIPEFKAVYDRLSRDIEGERLKKKDQSQRQVDTATMESLREDLGQDVASVADYEELLNAARGSWAQRVTSFKRNRRNRGLTSTENHMQSNMKIVKISDIAMLDSEYSYIKKHPSNNLQGGRQF